MNVSPLDISLWLLVVDRWWQPECLCPWLKAHLTHLTMWEAKLGVAIFFPNVMLLCWEWHISLNGGTISTFDKPRDLRRDTWCLWDWFDHFQTGKLQDQRVKACWKLYKASWISRWRFYHCSNSVGLLLMSSLFAWRRIRLLGWSHT
jgi:hypothetical protein